MATAPPTVTFTSVAGVCTHLRNGARRLLRKVPELELAAQNGHCAMFASMIKDKENVRLLHLTGTIEHATM